jgi:predicted secreted protein
MSTTHYGSNWLRESLWLRGSVLTLCRLTASARDARISAKFNHGTTEIGTLFPRCEGPKMVASDSFADFL